MGDTIKKRAWELDFARGTAVLLMSAFHAVFDLAEYFDVGVNYTSGFWFYVGRLSAILFMFISGISSTFSKNLFKRGVTVLCYGMIITAVSIPIMGAYYIRFGILHFFGTVMILKGVVDLLVKDAKIRNIIAALSIPASVALGKVLPDIKVDTPLLLPLGLMPSGFKSFDYYPVFPWLAFFSAGILTASAIYKEKRSVFKFDIGMNNYLVRVVGFLGGHSLIVYILHQPLIMAVLYIVFNIARIFS